MNRLLLALIFSTTLIQAAHADDASHRKLAEELLTLMDVPKNVEKIYQSVKKMQLAQLKNMNIPGGRHLKR